MSRRGAYAKGVAKREEILTRALDVVAEHGYRGASVREIADAVGLSPAGLLHYFDSKEELFTAILRTRDVSDFQTYRTEDGIGTFLAVLRHNAAVPGLVQLYVHLASEAADPAHPARAYFLERTERWEEFGRDWVAEGQRAGSIRPDLDPMWIIRTVHALADGLQPLWLLRPELDIAAHVESFLELLRPASATSATSTPAAVGEDA